MVGKIWHEAGRREAEAIGTVNVSQLENSSGEGASEDRCEADVVKDGFQILQPQSMINRQ